VTSANGKFDRSFFNSLTYFSDSSYRRNNIPRRHGTFLPEREGRKFFRMAPLKWIFHQPETFGIADPCRESGQRGGAEGIGRTASATLAKMKWTFHNILIMAIPCRQFSKLPAVGTPLGIPDRISGERFAWRRVPGTIPRPGRPTVFFCGHCHCITSNISHMTL